jgi:hypothetical protein
MGLKDACDGKQNFYTMEGLMKCLVVVIALLASSPISVISKTINLNFSNKFGRQNSYAFASRDYAEAYKYLTHSGYHYRGTLDSFLIIEGSQRRLDSLGDLVSQKDNRFIESTHNKYVPHFFIFELDSIYAMMGADSVIKAVLKWKGESIAQSKADHSIHVKIPQAGHGWSPHQDTLGDTLRGDAADTNFALSPNWFKKVSFFQHELVIEPIIMNTTDSITTLRTDFVEVVLTTSGNATFVLNPFQKPRNLSTIQISKSGKSQLTIQYQITNQAAIALDLFSLNGILIKRLDQGIKAPGTYSILWNKQSSPIPGGTYIVKLSDGKDTEAETFSIVR